MLDQTVFGFNNDPRVKKAAQDAVEHYGSGCSSSRFLNSLETAL